MARARTTVLGGRGRNAEAAELAAAQHDRDLLGALPAPLERELVAMAADLIRRQPHGETLDTLRTEFHRLSTRWSGPDTAAAARLHRTWTA
ncbi:hypothetical protein AWN90_04525 [Nocardia terpenica]|uniref:Uncharacterized protein n=1 Tax=Nocardia terpenica TaxID=455432 RepID=A0A161X9U5_9NOCA|nr:hypothetical protein AWN90_04525 [Nocardia terpenica]